VQEEPQSFEAFRGLGVDNRPSPGRRTLYLQPLAQYPHTPVLRGDLPSLPLVEDGFVTFVFAPAPDELRDFIAAFYDLPTEVREELDLEALVDGPSRVRRHHGQFNAHRVLTALETRLPDDAYSMTALMARDIYAEEAQEYAFGHALHTKRVAVASFAQLDPQFIGHARRDDFRRRIRERGYKLVAHEIGHTLGMAHCDEFRCVMNGVSHVGELDEAPLHLGPQCLAKLLWLVEADPAERYARLHEHYREHELAGAARWTAARIRRLAESD
jgi:archaemetzincin